MLDNKCSRWGSCQHGKSNGKNRRLRQARKASLTTCGCRKVLSPVKSEVADRQCGVQSRREMGGAQLSERRRKPTFNEVKGELGLTPFIKERQSK
jgi:hypothetical protein